MFSLLVFSTFEDLPMFFIPEGDWSRFEGVVINGYDDEHTDEQRKAYEALQAELTSLLYHPETGAKLLEEVTTDHLLSIMHEVGNIPDFIVRCGFAP